MLDENEAQAEPSAAIDTAEGTATHAEAVDATDGDSAAPDAARDATSQPGGPKKPTAEDRIAELTREKYALKRELEEARKAGQPKEPQKPAASDAKPSPDQFESYDAYIEALADWNYSQKEKASQAASAKEKELQAERSRQENFGKQGKAASTKYPDWEQVALAEHVPYSETSAKLVMESDMAGELAYHLGKNLEVAERIARLGDTDPVACAREIGRLEAKLSAPPPVRDVTSAPPPVKPVGGREPVKRGLQDLSTDEYIARRHQQMLKERAR